MISGNICGDSVWVCLCVGVGVCYATSVASRLDTGNNYCASVILRIIDCHEHSGIMLEIMGLTGRNSLCVYVQ